MAPVVQLLIGIVALTALVFAARYAILWSAVRKLRAPISLSLDFLIGQIEDPDVPLNDIGIEQRFAPGPLGEAVMTQYFVYPAKTHFFSFTRIVKGGKTTYKLGRWHRDVFPSDEFPPWPAPPCRSHWYVNRMRRLTDLLDAYPRKRLRSEQARRLIEAFEHDPPPAA